MTLREMAKRGCLFLSNEKCMKIAGTLKGLKWFKLKTHVFIKSLQRNKSKRTQHKEELADRIFSKMGVRRKWEQVTLFCYGHYIMSVTKTVLFLFSLKLKLVCLAPFLLSRGLNLSVVNYQNPGKHKEK